MFVAMHVEGVCPLGLTNEFASVKTNVDSRATHVRGIYGIDIYVLKVSVTRDYSPISSEKRAAGRTYAPSYSKARPD